MSITTITLKKGLEEEWQKAVNKNKDGYGKGVIKIVEKVCSELDKGKSPQEAESIGIEDSGITGFQAGAMASMINYFHPRGDEFRKYFNKVCGGTGKEKGTINPAIMTIS